MALINPDDDPNLIKPPEMSVGSRGPTGAEMNAGRAGTIATQTAAGNAQPIPGARPSWAGPTGQETNAARAGTIATQTLQGNAQPGAPARPGTGNFTTAAGAFASDQLMNSLRNGDPLSKNAQATEATNAARRAYLAKKANMDALGQTHFQPGSAQYQRAMDQTQAGIAQANQAGQASVNEYTRQRTQDLLGEARDLESTQYNRIQDEQRNRETQTANYLTQIPDQKGKSAFQYRISQGMSPEEAYRSVIGGYGEVQAPFQRQTPDQDRRLAAGAKVTAANPALKPGAPGYEEAVNKQIADEDLVTNAPVLKAKADADAAALKAKVDPVVKKMKSGADLTQEEKDLLLDSGDIPNFDRYGSIKLADIPEDARLVKLGGQGKAGGQYFAVQSRGTSKKGVPYIAVKDPKSGAILYMTDNALQSSNWDPTKN